MSCVFVCERERGAGGVTHQLPGLDLRQVAADGVAVRPTLEVDVQDVGVDVQRHGGRHALGRHLRDVCNRHAHSL